MGRRNGYAASRVAAPGGAFCLKAAALRREPGPMFVRHDSGVPARRVPIALCRGRVSCNERPGNVGGQNAAQWRAMETACPGCVRAGARDWGEAGGARLHPCRVARIAIVLVLCWCVRGSTASRTDGVEAMTYPEALHAVPASWGVAPREAVEGVWNQRVPKLATVAVNVAPQEVLCPSKAMGTPPTLKCSSPSMMTQS